MTTKELESMRLKLSAKATTNPEPMLRLRDVLEVLGAAMGTAGEVKPLDIEAAKAEARREALEDAIDVADEVIRLAYDEQEGYGLTPLTNLHGRLRKLRDACQPAPAEKKAVDVEALAQAIRLECLLVPVAYSDLPLFEAWVRRVAHAALDFIAKNGGTR